jgi:hypothetical protein
MKDRFTDDDGDWECVPAKFADFSHPSVVASLLLSVGFWTAFGLRLAGVISVPWKSLFGWTVLALAVLVALSVVWWDARGVYRHPPK